MSWQANAHHFGGCCLLGPGKADGRRSHEEGLIWPTLCLADCAPRSIFEILSKPHLIALVSAGPTYRSIQFHNGVARSSQFGAIFRVTGMGSPVTVSVLIGVGTIAADGGSIFFCTEDGRRYAAPADWSAIVTFDSRHPREPLYVLGEQCMDYGVNVLSPSVDRALLTQAA